MDGPRPLFKLDIDTRFPTYGLLAQLAPKIGARGDFVHILATKCTNVGSLALHHINSDLVTPLRGFSRLSGSRDCWFMGSRAHLHRKWEVCLFFVYIPAINRTKIGNQTPPYMDRDLGTPFCCFSSLPGARDLRFIVPWP